MEIAPLVGADGHKARTHCEAVHIARDIAIHVGNLVLIEVIACRESEIPVCRWADVARKREVLGDFPLIFEFVVVEIAVAVVDRVVDAQIPRY